MSSWFAHQHRVADSTAIGDVRMARALQATPTTREALPPSSPLVRRAPCGALGRRRLHALSNLVLLCRRHHRLVHHGFSVEMADGTPVFRRPDGSILENRAPP